MEPHLNLCQPLSDFSPDSPFLPLLAGFRHFRQNRHSLRGPFLPSNLNIRKNRGKFSPDSPFLSLNGDFFVNFAIFTRGISRSLILFFVYPLAIFCQICLFLKSPLSKEPPLPSNLNIRQNCSRFLPEFLFSPDSPFSSTSPLRPFLRTSEAVSRGKLIK